MQHKTRKTISLAKRQYTYTQNETQNNKENGRLLLSGDSQTEMKRKRQS